MWDRCRVQHFLHNGRNVRNSSFDIPPKRMSSWKLLESCTRLFRYTRKERPLTASTYNRLWNWSTIGGCSWKRNAPSTEMCHWMVSNEMWQWSSCHWMVSELSKRDHEAVRLHCDTSAELHDTWRRTLSFYNPLYSMHFDETTAQAKKQMDLTLRYWSPTHNEVIVAFYTHILYCVCWSRHSSVKKHRAVPWGQHSCGQTYTLVSDGLNANKAIMRKIEQTIKDEHPEFKGFVDLGSCVLHIVHNGFGKGLEMYGKDIDQLCLDLHVRSSSTVLRGERSTSNCRPT